MRLVCTCCIRRSLKYYITRNLHVKSLDCLKRTVKWENAGSGKVRVWSACRDEEGFRDGSLVVYTLYSRFLLQATDVGMAMGCGTIVLFLLLNLKQNKTKLGCWILGRGTHTSMRGRRKFQQTPLVTLRRNTPPL